MKKHITIIFACISLLGAIPKAFGKSNAKPVPVAAEVQSWVKLANFAAACDPIQISRLLQRDQKFDIYTNGGMTAMELLQRRLVSAIKSNDAAYINSCRKAMTVLMEDNRYQWKENIIGRKTDLMNLVEVLTDWPQDQVNSVDLPGMLATLRKKPDFDINYQTLGATGPDRPRTVAGTIAESGNVYVWCQISKIMPAMGEAMDERQNQNQYTPLLLAAAAGRGQMVKLLIAEGADWLVNIQNMNDTWPVELLARNSSDHDLSAWLIKHKGATSREAGCSK